LDYDITGWFKTFDTHEDLLKVAKEFTRRKRENERPMVEKCSKGVSLILVAVWWQRGG